MKKLKRKTKIYLILQIIFAILTFVGFILLLIGKISNAGMSIICMLFSLIFGNFYKSSIKSKNNLRVIR